MLIDWKRLLELQVEDNNSVSNRHLEVVLKTDSNVVIELSLLRLLHCLANVSRVNGYQVPMSCINIVLEQDFLSLDELVMSDSERGTKFSILLQPGHVCVLDDIGACHLPYHEVTEVNKLCIFHVSVELDPVHE